MAVLAVRIAGGALGVAMAVAVERCAVRAESTGGQDAMSGALLGPAFSDEEIGAHLDGAGIPYK
ncbi:hypothetical protein [Streptomyces shenzhenensis]|uniref:hypothetical protein n=1 Tax=Streptomyces shenzhenensis TaxID=943815 RepID=UPI001604FD09|nr:hypothetical protein [Streptomyces shenzhenensis]